VLVPVFKRSRRGFIAAAIFLLMFLTLFAWVFIIASKNPADSGESGILLLPFAMPWITLVPETWLGPLGAFVSVIFNALIVYSIFGGVRLRRS
jgi:hypothetical protein